MEMQTIVRNNTDAKVEEMKLKLNLSGDVYIYNNHFMESLESHKKLFPESSATTIEQAYLERVEYEQEKLRLQQEQAAQNAELEIDEQEE